MIETNRDKLRQHLKDASLLYGESLDHRKTVDDAISRLINFNNKELKEYDDQYGLHLSIKGMDDAMFMMNVLTNTLLGENEIEDYIDIIHSTPLVGNKHGVTIDMTFEGETKRVVYTKLEDKTLFENLVLDVEERIMDTANEILHFEGESTGKKYEEFVRLVCSDMEGLVSISQIVDIDFNTVIVMNEMYADYDLEGNPFKELYSKIVDTAIKIKEIKNNGYPISINREKITGLMLAINESDETVLDPFYALDILCRALYDMKDYSISSITSAVTRSTKLIQQDNIPPYVLQGLGEHFLFVAGCGSDYMARGWDASLHCLDRYFDFEQFASDRLEDYDDLILFSFEGTIFLLECY